MEGLSIPGQPSLGFVTCIQYLPYHIENCQQISTVSTFLCRKYHSGRLYLWLALGKSGCSASSSANERLASAAMANMGKTPQCTDSSAFPLQASANVVSGIVKSQPATMELFATLHLPHYNRTMGLINTPFRCSPTPNRGFQHTSNCQHSRCHAEYLPVTNSPIRDDAALRRGERHGVLFAHQRV